MGFQFRFVAQFVAHFVAQFWLTYSIRFLWRLLVENLISPDANITPKPNRSRMAEASQNRILEIDA